MILLLKADWQCCASVIAIIFWPRTIGAVMVAPSRCAYKKYNGLKHKSELGLFLCSVWTLNIIIRGGENSGVQTYIKSKFLNVKER